MWRGILCVALVLGLAAAARAQQEEAAERPAEAKLDSAQAVQQHVQATVREIVPLARSQPDEAAKKLEALKESLAKAGEDAEPAVKTAIAGTERTVAALEEMIASGKRLAELVGKDALPLNVEKWVNGEPLTDADLKGKVVLLDFWAVWCGPCIATFPHLREWNEKYADKGLVMIGLTRYYNMRWDEDAKRAVRATGDDKVPPEEEHEMLEKFAGHHGLAHRFAIQEDRETSDYYAVTGIPHVVVIDQQGKVRLIRVGSGDANAKDIEAMLEKLLGAE